MVVLREAHNYLLRELEGNRMNRARLGGLHTNRGLLPMEPIEVLHMSLVEEEVRHRPLRIPSRIEFRILFHRFVCIVAPELADILVHTGSHTGSHNESRI